MRHKVFKLCENRARDAPLRGVHIPHFDQIWVKFSFWGVLHPCRCSDGGEIWHAGMLPVTTTVLRPFVGPGEPVPEETFTHPPSWSSSFYQLLPSTTIHSILHVQITCLAIFLQILSPCPLWSISWSGALQLIFHTFLHPVIVFFLQHMPIPSQPGLL